MIEKKEVKGTAGPKPKGEVRIGLRLHRQFQAVRRVRVSPCCSTSWTTRWCTSTGTRWSLGGNHLPRSIHRCERRRGLWARWNRRARSTAIVLHVGPDEMTSREGAHERELASHDGRHDDASETTSIVSRRGWVGSADAEDVEDCALWSKDSSSTYSPNFDRGHRTSHE